VALLSMEKRIEGRAGGAALLDAGENEKAATYFERSLDRRPGLVESAEGLIEARSRLCAPLRGVAFASQSLKSLSGTEHELLKSYLDGARSRIDRKFVEAAALFASAAEAARRSGDSLSVAVCEGSRAQCFLAAADAGRAREALGELRRAIARPGAPEVIAPEALAVEAECLEAALLRLENELDRADDLYRSTLSRARAKGFRGIESLCLAGIGSVEEGRGKDAEARQFYVTALSLERSLRDTEGVARILSDLAQVEVRLGALADAERRLSEARKLAESCGQKWILARIYYGQGALAEARGEEQAALRLFQKSLAGYRDEADSTGMLAAHVRLGRLNSRLGEYVRSIGHYRRSLPAYEAAKDASGLSSTLGALALAYHKLGDYANADVYYRLALARRRDLGDAEGAAWCLESMGSIAFARGRCREAVSFEKGALAVYERLDDRAGMGRVRFALGSISSSIGDGDEALRYYERAFALAELTHDGPLLEQVVGGMGSAYLSAGRVDLAQAPYERCLALARGAKDANLTVWSLNSLAALSLGRGETEEARARLRDAMALLPNAGQDSLRARTLYLLGASYGAEPLAASYLEQSLSLASGIGLEDLRWRCLSELGELRLAEGDTAQAYSLQHRAIVAVESLRRLAGSDELRPRYAAPVELPYERIVSLILGRPGGTRDVREAFSYTERCRAQRLAAALRGALDRAGRSGDEQILERERDLLSRLTYYQARVQGGALAPEERKQYLDKIAGVEGRFVNLKLQLDRSDKAYAAALYPNVEQPEELLSALEPGERMLSYCLGEGSSYLFVGQGRELRAFELPPRAEIERRVEDLVALLERRAREAEPASADSTARRADAASRQTLDAACSGLYELLVAPAGMEIGSKGPLIIIPDGLLDRLPFALLSRGGRYLVQDHELSYAPSLRMLRSLRERSAVRDRSRHIPRYNIIAVGCAGGGTSAEGVAGSAADAASSGSGALLRVSPCTGRPIDALPSADAEAKRMASVFPEGLVLTGTAAVEASIKSIPIDDTGILHLAALAYVDDEDARRSFIVLNREPNLADTLASPSDDGLLEWHEIAALRLNAALVTLGSCRSAGGPLVAGGGAAGLAQAFLHAGGSCVVAAELDVPDTLASAFIAELYRKVRGGASAAVALRAAQLEAIERSDALEEPFIWGAFAAFGDGRSAPRLSRELSPTTTVALVLLALTAAGILINIFRRRPIF